MWPKIVPPPPEMTPESATVDELLKQIQAPAKFNYERILDRCIHHMGGEEEFCAKMARSFSDARVGSVAHVSVLKLFMWLIERCMAKQAESKLEMESVSDEDLKKVLADIVAKAHHP